MTVFADSSAVVKLYVPEDGAAEVRAVAEPVAISQLARVEVPAALWRKHRIGELDAHDASVLVSAFEADYGAADDGFAVVAITAGVLDAAARHAARHGLRAYDAVQLASADACRAASPDMRTVAAFDRSLRSAAASEGFMLVPATLPPRPGEAAEDLSR